MAASPFDPEATKHAPAPRKRGGRRGSIVGWPVLGGIVVGLVLAGVGAFSKGGPLDTPDDGVTIPGASTFPIDAGDLEAWYERDRHSMGKTRSSSFDDVDIDCSIKTPSGAPIELRRGDRRHYASFGDEGFLVWEFTTPETGLHAIDCTGTAGRLLFERAGVSTLKMGLLIGGLCLLAASTLVIVVAIRRSRR